MARDVLFRTLQLGIVVGGIIGGSIWLARFRLPLLFSSDPKVQAIAAGTLPLLSIFMVGTHLNIGAFQFTLSSCLHGSSNTSCLEDCNHAQPIVS